MIRIFVERQIDKWCATMLKKNNLLKKINSYIKKYCNKYRFKQIKKKFSTCKKNMNLFYWWPRRESQSGVVNLRQTHPQSTHNWPHNATKKPPPPKTPPTSNIFQPHYNNNNRLHYSLTFNFDRTARVTC